MATEDGPAQEPASAPIRVTSLLAFAIFVVVAARRVATRKSSDGDVLATPSIQAPQTLDPAEAQEPVPASIRVMSLLAFAIFAFFGAKTEHWVPEVGLAFVTGGTLFATPQLAAALIASAGDKQSSAFKTHLRRVIFVGVIALGILIFKARPPGLNGLKLAILFAAALLEVVMVIGVAPFWLGDVANTVLSSEEPNWFSRFVGKLRRCVRNVTKIPQRWIATIEEDDGFLIVGAGLFLVGTIMQFLAGA
jgi:hypothetical protein